MATNLKGINIGGFGGYELTDILNRNLKMWLDWGLGIAGAIGTASFATSGYLGANPECFLKIREDERYESGRVWDGMGKEWVWESGLATRVSGVYINGDFHPNGCGLPYAFKTDYRNGRIVFAQPVDPNAEVSLEYQWRQVDVAFADSEIFRSLIHNSIDGFVNETPVTTTPARENQIIMPAIFIDFGAGTARGLQLGGGQIKTRQIILQIFANNANDRNLLLDWLDYQNRTTFNLCDLNSIDAIFDSDGDVMPNATNWIEMANAHPWRKMRIVDGKCIKIDSLNPNIFRGRVEWSVEIDLGGI